MQTPDSRVWCAENAEHVLSYKRHSPCMRCVKHADSHSEFSFLFIPEHVHHPCRAHLRVISIVDTTSPQLVYMLTRFSWPEHKNFPLSSGSPQGWLGTPQTTQGLFYVTHSTAPRAILVVTPYPCTCPITRHSSGALPEPYETASRASGISNPAVRAASPYVSRPT